jgi:diguanylate cyclase (GGDEF)-like protein
MSAGSSSEEVGAPPSAALDPGSPPTRILHIEPDDAAARALAESLARPERGSFHITRVAGVAQAVLELGRDRFGVILVGIAGQEPGGMDSFRRIASQAPGSPILILTDLDGEAIAHTAVQKGAAQDYLVKDQLLPGLLERAIHYALERGRMVAAVRARRRREVPPSSFDRLTQLPNRQTFYDRLGDSLSQAREQNRMMAVLLLGLEGFKLVNDTLGPSVGDPLMQSIADRLRAGVPGSQVGRDLVARLSGDEFAILLSDVPSMKEVARIAEAILETFNRPFVQNGLEFFISSMVGISLYPFDGGDVETMIHNADIALRRAKEQGSNTHQFYLPAVNDQFLTRLELQNSLRIALAREEFLVHYMPQIDVASGRIVSMEALARWRHPRLGLVQPGDFIPLAEETGLILPIGERVLRTACAQAHEWQKAGLPPIRVSVNVSARQFQHQNPAALVSRVLGETGLAPGNLELEITESTLMKDADSALATLRALKDTGVHLAIDDFGTGYSSLSYLRFFPIDALKVDRSFVREVTTRSDDAAIVSAIIAMAHSLKLKVIAEGVEHEHHLEWLHSARCDEVQGFHFSRPVPAEGAARLLHKSRPLP